MIIKREYVTFRRLVEGGDIGGKIFIEAFRQSYPEERWEELYTMLADQCLFQRDMGWAFGKIGMVIDNFEKLDIEHPYDNGFSFKDVSEGEVIYRDEESITMHLINWSYGIKSIVKVIEIKND